MAFAKKPEGTASTNQALEKRAREHFEQGRDYYAQKRYEEALAEFESAYRIQPSPELEVNIAYSLWGLGRTDEAKQKFRKSYRHAEDPALEAAALQALQSLTVGEVGDDGLTPLPRKAAKGALLVAGAATAVGMVTGGIAIEQALVAGKQGFDRPQGLINATEISFSVGVGAAAVSAGILFIQRGITKQPVRLALSKEKKNEETPAKEEKEE